MIAPESCPPMEDLAAFLDGRISGEERDRMVRHLSECPTCMEVYALVARMNEEPEAPVEQTTPEAAIWSFAEEMKAAPEETVRHQTGKYRRSEVAARLGPYAVELEKFMVLGERTFHEAFEHLRPEFYYVSEEQAEAIAKGLPARAKRRFVGEEALATRPPSDAGADTLFLERERAGRRKRLLDVLDEALGRLSEEDRLIVRLHFDDKWTIVQIANHLKRDPKPLFKHLQRILNRLREDLERNFPRQDFAEAFEQNADDDTDPETGGNR